MKSLIETISKVLLLSLIFTTTVSIETPIRRSLHYRSPYILSKTSQILRLTSKTFNIDAVEDLELILKINQHNDLIKHLFKVSIYNKNYEFIRQTLLRVFKFYSTLMDVMLDNDSIRESIEFIKTMPYHKTWTSIYKLDKQSLLNEAIEKEKFQMVKFFLEHNKFIFKPNYKGDKPLDFFMRTHPNIWTRVFAVLDKNITNSQGESLLDIIIRDFLLKKNKINSENVEGIVTFLINNGARTKRIMLDKKLTKVERDNFKILKTLVPLSTFKKIEFGNKFYNHFKKNGTCTLYTDEEILCLAQEYKIYKEEIEFEIRRLRDIIIVNQKGIVRLNKHVNKLKEYLDKYYNVSLNNREIENKFDNIKEQKKKKMILIDNRRIDKERTQETILVLENGLEFKVIRNSFKNIVDITFSSIKSASSKEKEHKMAKIIERIKAYERKSYFLSTPFTISVILKIKSYLLKKNYKYPPISFQIDSILKSV